MQNNFSKCREWVPRGTSQHKWRWLTTLLLILTLGIGQMWADDCTTLVSFATSQHYTSNPRKVYGYTSTEMTEASRIELTCDNSNTKGVNSGAQIRLDYGKYLQIPSQTSVTAVTIDYYFYNNNSTTDVSCDLKVEVGSTSKTVQISGKKSDDYKQAVFTFDAAVTGTIKITNLGSGNSNKNIYLDNIEFCTASSGCTAPTNATITANPANAEYTAGGNISLTASAENATSATFTWYKGTDWATASAGSSVGTGATFSKNSCTTDDEGTYWCNISNGTGCEVQVSKAITVASSGGGEDPEPTCPTEGQLYSAVTTATGNISIATTTGLELNTSTHKTTVSGGKMYVISGQSSNKNLITNGAFCQTNDNTFFKIELDCALAAGDVISISVGKDGSNTRGVWVSTATSKPSSAPACALTAKSSTLTPKTYTVTSTDEYVGKKVFYIYRATGNSTYFNNVVITRPYSVSYDNLKEAAHTMPAKAVEFTLQELTNATFNHTGWTADKLVKVGGVDKVAGTALGKTDKVTLTDNTTFTAVWEAKVTKHTVTYYDGEAIEANKLGSELINEGSNPTGAGLAPKKHGYTFGGWSLTNGGDAIASYASVTVDADKELFVVWTPVVCPTSGVVFSIVADPSKAPDSDYQIAGNTRADLATYATITRGAAVFGNADGNQRITINSSTGAISLTSSNMRGYVKATMDCDLQEGDIIRITDNTNKFRVAFDSTATDKVDVSSGNHDVVIDAAHKDKYEFFIYRNGNDVTFSTIQVIRPYTVSFNMNGKTATAIDAQKVADGGKVTKPADPTTTNYTFEGWYKEAACTNAWDFTNDVVNTDVVLFAKWTAWPTMTLNRGAAPSGDDVDGGQFAPGASVEVPACPFSYTDYNFNGWEYSPAVTMVDETHFTMPSENLTLTAQWVDANNVAQIGSTKYATLEAALADAANGTIELLQDIDVTAQVEIAAGVTATIDLAGHKIEYTGDATLPSGVILVHNGASLTINDSSDPDAGSIVSGDKAYAAVALTKAGDDAANPATLTVNGGTLSGYYYGITGNGSRHNTVTTINGGTIIGTCTGDNLGIYHPQNGTLTINGGTITAYSAAVEMRAGTLVINNGTLTATAPAFSCNPNGSGTTTVGAAIAIAQHTTKVDIAVTINGGEFNGVKAVNESNPQVNDPAPQVAMAITDGEFNGAVETVDVNNYISGGTFSNALADAQCATDYYPATKPNGKYGVTVAALSVNFVDEANAETPTAWATFLNNNHYDYNLGDGGEISWDKANAYDTGLKLKKSTNNAIYFTTEPDKVITLTVGNIAGMTIQINGGATQTITGGTNNDNLGVSYYYSDNAQAVVLKETSGNNGYNMLKSINIRDPYTVSFDANGGDAVASLKATPAINLPSATNGTQNFAGWYDALDNLIGNAGDPYTPTANITLVAHWEAISTDNTLSDLKVGGETVDGFSPSVHTYYVVLPYGTKPENIPAITATANSAKAKQVAIQQAVWTGEPYNCYRAQANVQAEDNSWGYYDVRFSFAPKDMACLIKATVTGDNAMAIDASASMFEGTPDIYKVYGNAETYESKLAPKFQGDGYLGVTLTTAGAAFQEGDVVRVFATKGIDNVAKLYVYSDNTGTAAKQIAESETALVKGYNEAALTAAGEGATSVFLCRAGQYTSWNPCIYDIAVYRAVPKPVLSAITIGGATENAVNQSTKTISLEISAVAAADLANLSVTPTFMSNDLSQTTGAVTSNEGAWVLGANTYLVTDKDGDTETYTINLSAAAGIKEVVISGTLAVLEDETTTLSAVVYDTNDQVASIQDVTWSVKAGDEALASVTSAGVVTGKAVGTAHIIATSVADNTKSAEVAVVVSENPCRAWSNPSSKETGATIGKMVVTPTGIGTLQENMTPYQGASATNAWKLDSKDSRYAEIKFTDNAQFESLLLGVSSKDNDKNYKFAVVCSSAAGDGFAAGVLSATTYEAVDQDEAENLVDVELPVGTKAVRVYRQYTNDYGGDKSVFLYYINACKKELVALTSIAVADKTLAVGVAGTPAVTLTPANADVASYVWEIENDGTGAAVISAKGVISSTATGVVTVKVTATDALNNVVASNVATVNIVNKFVDVAPVTETTNWNWSGIASENIVISDVDTVLANYYSGSQWERIAGKAANDQYAYRAEGHDCYQGTYLFFKTTVPGMLTINSRYASNGAKIEVNGNEIATLTGNYANYSVAVPAGDVKIVATGGQKMRIKTMTFDTDLAAYQLTDNKLNGYERPVTEGRYGTICLPNGGVMVGASIYTLAYYGETSKKIFFDEVVDGTMEAGKPYLFLPNEGIDRIGVFYTDAANEPNKTVNGFVGYIGASEDPNDALQVPAGEGNYIVQNNQYREILTGATAYILSHRAYIHFAGINTSEPAKAPGARRIGISGAPQVVTGVDGLNVGDQPVKLIIDGQMYILRGDKMYDATGRLVK